MKHYYKDQFNSQELAEGKTIEKYDNGKSAVLTMRGQPRVDYSRLGLWQSEKHGCQQ